MTSVPPVRIRRDLRVMIASVLDGAAAPDHLRSVAGLMVRAQGRLDEYRYVCASVYGEADRTRNALAGAFLASGATHLVLVDGAIGFDPAAVLDVIDRMRADPALAVMVAACPARHINWGLVAAASASGVAGENPAELARFAGQFTLDLIDSSSGMRVDQPVELATAEAGLMVLRRDVFETLCERHPELRYAPEPQDCEAGEVGDMLHALFQSTVDPATSRLLSGTALFSYRARSAGFRLWLAPWLKTTSTGSARFAGSLADLADLEPPAPE